MVSENSETVSLKCLCTSSIREKPPHSTAKMDKEITWKKSTFHSHFCQFLDVFIFKAGKDFPREGHKHWKEKH